MFTCEFCKKEFINKYTLNTHQTKQKSCLEIQGLSAEHIYTCLCNKSFTFKASYDRHLLICKQLNNRVEELEKENEILEIRFNELEKEHLVVKTTLETKVNKLEIEVSDYKTEITILKTRLEERLETSNEKNKLIENHRPRIRYHYYYSHGPTRPLPPPRLPLLPSNPR